MATALNKENFPEANDVLQAAPEDAGRVRDLDVFRQCWPHVLQVYNEHRAKMGLEPVSFPEGATCVISKWKFTPDEMHVLNANGGEFYLQFMGGTHSPVAVWGTSPWASTQVEPETVGDYISPEDARREEDDGPEIDIK